MDNYNSLKEETCAEIARRLEWRNLVYMGVDTPSIYTCPICGGVKPSEYDKYKFLKNDKSANRGHIHSCLYKIIIKQEND